MFNRGEKVTFHCALHPEVAFRSKDPFASQWFPANEYTNQLEFMGTMNNVCPCTLKNGVWLTSFDYTNTEGREVPFLNPNR